MIIYKRVLTVTSGRFSLYLYELKKIISYNAMKKNPILFKMLVVCHLKYTLHANMSCKIYFSHDETKNKSLRSVAGFTFLQYNITPHHNKFLKQYDVDLTKVLIKNVFKY